MQFIDDKRLIMHTQSDGWIVWDAISGKKLTTFEGDGPNSAGVALSTDGKYMAVTDHNSVLVYDTQRGKVAARMATVHNGKELNLFWCSGIAFSPDMSELAGLFSDGQFVVWSNKGEILVEEVLHGVSSGVGQDSPNVFYLPDKSGWFIDGNKLLDRKTMSFVWEIDKVRWHDTYSCVMDQNTVMTTADNIAGVDLMFLEIPWEKIRAGIEKMQPDAEPILTRGGSVSVQCNVGEVRFADAAQTKSTIMESFKTRLAQNELSIAENQAVSIVIEYAEKAGGQKRIRGFFGRVSAEATETVVEDTVITLNVEMRVAGRAEPIWKDQLESASGLIIDAEELTPQAFRNENFERVRSGIARMTFPTRISKDENSALPVKTSL